MSLSTVGDGISAIRDAVAECAPTIRDGIDHRRHTLDDVNPSGHDVLAADAFADDVLESRLTGLDAIGEYASEERDDVIESTGPLSCCVDPLDGSKNLESGNAAGTIYGVYEGSLPADGSDLVAAGYVLYGPQTTMVHATERTVTRSVIEDDGSLRVVESDLTIPADPTVCGFGGCRTEWSDRFTAYADGVRERLKTRYSGAFVADVTQVLTFGGMFAYPALRTAPSGKLRHQFEAVPMAYILESAGGRSSDGTGSLLESSIDDIHGRVPVYLGNETLVDRVEAIV